MNDQALLARLEIVLDRDDGHVIRLGIVRTSGITAFDIAALDAVQRAPPSASRPRRSSRPTAMSTSNGSSIAIRSLRARPSTLALTCSTPRPPPSPRNQRPRPPPSRAEIRANSKVPPHRKGRAKGRSPRLMVYRRATKEGKPSGSEPPPSHFSAALAGRIKVRMRPMRLAE